MLSICIPTYNRRERIEKNLNMLSKYIYNNFLNDKLEIIVSNNNSQDDTKEFLDRFLKENFKLNLKFYNQEKNLEIQKNQLFVVAQSSYDYFMWLSDDDFIEEEYLLKVLDIISSNKEELISIIPSYQHILPNGKLLNIGRDFNKKNRLYTKGFKTCLFHSWKAHQMSGLVFSKKILKVFNERGIDNLYPFIFFSSYSQIKGKFYYITEHPIKITANVKKYWTYENDGLINGIMENFKKLYEVSYLKRIMLEVYFLFIQRGRYLNYRFQIYKVYKELIFSKNITIITKILLAPIMGLALFYNLGKKLLRYFGEKK